MEVTSKPTHTHFSVIFFHLGYLRARKCTSGLYFWEAKIKFDFYFFNIRPYFLAFSLLSWLRPFKYRPASKRKLPTIFLINFDYFTTIGIDELLYHNNAGISDSFYDDYIYIYSFCGIVVSLLALHLRDPEFNLLLGHVIIK